MGVLLGFDWQQFGIGVHAGRGRVTIMLTWLFISMTKAEHRSDV